MGNIGGKTPLPGEGLLKAGEHPVDSPGQAGQLIVSLSLRDAAAEIRTAADLLGGLRDARHGKKGPAGHAVSPQRRDQNEQRHA